MAQPQYEPQASSWQDAASMYGPGGMSRPNLGYPDYSSSSAAGSNGASGSPSPYGYVGGGGYGTSVGGGYNGRFVDTAPYGGLIEPTRPAGYMDPRGGNLFDYAPQPLHNPPPQYGGAGPGGAGGYRE